MPRDRVGYKSFTLQNKCSNVWIIHMKCSHLAFFVYGKAGTAVYVFIR